jgi:hypothetical protein
MDMASYSKHLWFSDSTFEPHHVSLGFMVLFLQRRNATDSSKIEQSANFREEATMKSKPTIINAGVRPF